MLDRRKEFQMKATIILGVAVGIHALSTIAQSAAYQDRVVRIERGEYASRIDETTQKSIEADLSQRDPTSILLMLITHSGSAQSGEQMTRLDAALKAVQQDHSKTGEYYTLFLKTDLYIPTYDTPEKDNYRRAQQGDKFTPVILDREGKKYLAVFDTMERLQGWAKQPIGYVRMASHALLSAVDSSIHIVLNPGTGYAKEFVSDELKELQEAVGRTIPKEQEVPAGTQVLVGAPAKTPDGLEEAIRTCLSRDKEVEAAYIGQVMVMREGEKPHLVLVLEVGPVTGSVFSAIVQEVGIAIKGLLKDGEYLDMLRYERQGLASRIVKRVEPFYVRFRGDPR
jgi:hypothetical protein